MAKGFWGLLQKAGLVEEVPDKVVEPSNGTATATTPSTAPITVDPKQRAEELARIASVDNMVREQLASAMEGAGANLVEELGDLLETLGDSIPDEKLRYSTALKIISKKGFSIQAICTDIDKCIGVLEEKDREFNTQLQSQFDSRVGGKSKQVKNCEEQIALKQQQIESLQQEIAVLVASKAQNEGGIIEERQKLQQVQERFEISYKAIRTEIESQRAKVTQYGEV